MVAPVAASVPIAARGFRLVAAVGSVILPSPPHAAATMASRALAITRYLMNPLGTASSTAAVMELNSCGGLAISERPMALRTGLATGMPFSSEQMVSRAGEHYSVHRDRTV